MSPLTKECRELQLKEEMRASRVCASRRLERSTGIEVLTLYSSNIHSHSAKVLVTLNIIPFITVRYGKNNRSSIRPQAAPRGSAGRYAISATSLDIMLTTLVLFQEVLSVDAEGTADGRAFLRLPHPRNSEYVLLNGSGRIFDVSCYRSAIAISSVQTKNARGIYE